MNITTLSREDVQRLGEKFFKKKIVRIKKREDEEYVYVIGRSSSSLTPLVLMVLFENGCAGPIDASQIEAVVSNVPLPALEWFLKLLWLRHVHPDPDPPLISSFGC